ncbi:MAG: replicative DNA helicase [Bacteroidales bacterium]|nr:replicative DNA helicase [Bacteroidales bacterium]
MPNEQTTERRTEQRYSYNTLQSALGNTGKVIPQALPFEKAVLGALMIDGGAIDNVANTLRPEMFYNEKHQHIYAAIFQLATKDEPVDLLTVVDQLRAENKLEFVGGAAYVASLTNGVTSAANVEYHARIVMERYVLRQLIKVCGDITKDAFAEPKDVMTVLDKAETELFNIVESNFSRESKELVAVVKKSIDEIVEIQNSEDKFNGVPTGIRSIDEMIGGWQNSDLIILAARPAMGKTSFVLTVARNAAISAGKSVALFSLEMSATQLAHRLFAIESGIDASKISKGKLDESEWAQLMDRIQPLNTNKLIIDDTPGLSIFDLRAKCRRLKHRYDINLIIIDYLQLMQANSDDNHRDTNRVQEISQISRSLKMLAKDLNVPVIALSQLSRAVDQRTGDHRPVLSDLRESGSIEQDADQVLFIYRPEYYKFETFDDGKPTKDMAEVIIAKNRHGSGGTARVKFLSRFTKFIDDDSEYTDGSISISETGGLSPNVSANSGFVTFDSSINEDAQGMDVNQDMGLPY